MISLGNTPACASVAMSLSDFGAAYGTHVHPENRSNLMGCGMRDDRISADQRDWYGGIKSVGEAETLLNRGWAEGAARLTTIAADMAPPTAKTRKRMARWESEGDDLHVERALRGDWDSAWRTTRRQWSPGPATVTLYTPVGGGAYLTSENLFWRGAVALVVADLLESAGYSVEIVASWLVRDEAPDQQGRGRGRLCRANCTLKDPGQPLTIDALASVLCHAGVIRTFGFAMIASIPHNVGDALGYNASAKADWDTLRAAGEIPEGSIVIAPVTDEAGCRAEIERVIASLS